MTTKTVDKILIKNNYDSAHLVAILQQVQSVFNYLPEEAMHKVADQLNLPVSHIYAVATFYKAFSLTPRGDHQVHICTGTACHVRGAPMILGQLQRDLGIGEGETTDDLKFSLDTVRCVGCCSLAPVVRIDEETYGKVTQRQTSKILKKYR